jgi:hypothetical protein
MPAQKKEIRANQHASYRQFTTIAVLLPFVGIILSIIYLTKEKQVDKKLGTHLLIVSVVSSAICSLIYILIVSSAVNNATHSSLPASQNTSTNSTQSSDVSKDAFGKFGDALNIGGNDGLSVTLTRIVDPVTNQYATPDTGSRFLAIELKITNNSKAHFDSVPSTDMIVTGSDKKGYQHQVTATGSTIGCSDFSSTTYSAVSLDPGQSDTGCMLYQVPNSVTISDVTYTSSTLNGDFGDWTAK